MSADISLFSSQMCFSHLYGTDVHQIRLKSVYVFLGYGGHQNPSEHISGDIADIRRKCSNSKYPRDS